MEKFVFVFSTVKGFPEDELEKSNNATQQDDDDDYKMEEELPDEADEDDIYDYAADEASDYDYYGRKTSSTTTTTTIKPWTTSSPSKGWDDNDDSNKSKDGEDSDICLEIFDSVAVIRNELFVFLNQMLWRYSHRGVLRYILTRKGFDFISFNILDLDILHQLHRCLIFQQI